MIATQIAAKFKAEMQANESIGFVDTSKNVAAWVWTKLTVDQRVEVMDMVGSVSGGISKKFDACLSKIVELAEL